jgi:hypothetical protein
MDRCIVKFPIYAILTTSWIVVLSYNLSIIFFFLFISWNILLTSYNLSIIFIYLITHIHFLVLQFVNHLFFFSVSSSPSSNIRLSNHNLSIISISQSIVGLTSCNIFYPIAQSKFLNTS